MTHFQIILTVETLPELDAPKEIYKRIKKQIMRDCVLNCQTIKVEMKELPK